MRCGNVACKHSSRTELKHASVAYFHGRYVGTNKKSVRYLYRLREIHFNNIIFGWMYIIDKCVFLWHHEINPFNHIFAPLYVGTSKNIHGLIVPSTSSCNIYTAATGIEEIHHIVPLSGSYQIWMLGGVKTVNGDSHAVYSGLRIRDVCSGENCSQRIVFVPTG